MPHLPSAPPKTRTTIMEPLEGRTLLANLVGGVDPYNMGKGEWVFRVSTAQNSTGTTASVAKFVDYLKARGFKWVIVKAGDGNNGPGTSPYTQFNKTLIDAVHAAGMKIFGYHFVYGGVTPNSKSAPTTQSGEKTVRDQIMALNPDGLIIDAENEWDTNSNANSIAEDYAKTFKQKYPTKLLGLDTFAYARFHTKFPYLAYGKYVDVVMPQMWWKSIANAGTPKQILADVDQDWKGLYNDFLKQGHPEAIKPIVPIGQGFDVSSTNQTPSSEITQFFDLLRNDTNPASPFGYNGVSFWSAQHHTSAQWTAISNGTLSAPSGSISGNVFNDLDTDGAREPDESGISGRTVFDDTDDDGVRDGNEPQVKTDSQGNYTLNYMAARTHGIWEEVPLGWRQTFPANLGGHVAVVSQGQAVTGKNFGTTQLARVAGTVYHDRDGDAIKDGDETGLAGWTIFADADQDGILDDNEFRTRSNRKGNYVLNIPAGRYFIREVLGSGYRVTAPASGFYDVTLANGQSLTRHFGNTTLILITGFVFNDKDGDGLKETGENGLQGWRVFADFDGDGVWDADEDSALTDSTGKYRLASLDGGSYRIAVLQQAGWRPTVPNPGARKITLADGGTTSNKNFGQVAIA